MSAGETFRSFDGPSWLKHVYRKLKNKPTPHYIENILGLHKSDSEPETHKNVTKHPETFTAQPAVTEVNEPLNLSFDGPSWLKHVYRKLKNKPTPHYIENILGLPKSDSEPETYKNVTKHPETFTAQPAVTEVKSHLTCRLRVRSEYERKAQKLEVIISQPAVTKANEPPNLSIKVRTRNSKDSKGAPEQHQRPQTTAVVNHKDSDVEQIAEDADGKNKKKKARTTFTGRQIFELEKQFEVKKYLSSSERSEMAKLLNVTETQVCPMSFIR
nr:unnamed protein product [Callosobruchus analis]